MKLRSGKIVGAFPEELEKKLESKLQKFKILFSGNPQHAKELLDLISKVYSFDHRVDISCKVQEVYDPNLLATHKLLGSAGTLARLLVENYQYHATIAEKIRNYDLDIPMLGNVEEYSSEE